MINRAEVQERYVDNPFLLIHPVAIKERASEIFFFLLEYFCKRKRIVCAKFSLAEKVVMAN